MKILKILGIAAGVHALALILLLSSPGCSNTKAATSDASPISSAPADASAPSGAAITMPDSVGIRYSPTRPGTTVASALETQPVSDVTPVTTYTVVKGDTLSTIARKNKLSKADLASANKLKSGSVLHQGQKLILPSKQVPAAPSAPVAAQAKTAEPAPAEKIATESTKHVVKPGETLGGIARKYGVKQGEIAVANNITDPRKIQPGQELVIPARSTSTTGKAPRAAKPSTADTADAPSKAQAPAAADQDLDAGLKPTGASDVPVVKIEDTSSAQPKNP